MKILGIDPGTGRTGWAILEKNGPHQKLIDCGCFETKANSPLPDRLEKIFQFINELIKTHRPDEAGIESIFFASNAKTAFAVGQARGVVLLALKTASVPISSYSPLEIKRSVTGYGQADKRQVGEMVKMLLNLKEIPKPDDAADAVAVALTHAATNKTLKMK